MITPTQGVTDFITPMQGVTYFIIPPIAAVAAHKITRNGYQALFTAFGTGVIAYGARNYPETTAKVLTITFTTLAAGTLLYAATETIEISVPLAPLTGFGLAAFWPEATPQPKKAHNGLDEFDTQIKTLSSEAEKGITGNNFNTIVGLTINIQEWLLSLNGGATQEIKKQANESVNLAQLLISSYFSAEKVLSEAQIEREMQDELQKQFNLIRVDGDGSCAPRAILALADKKLNPRSDNKALNEALRPKVLELRKNIAAHVRKRIEEKDEIVIKLFTNDPEAKEVDAEVVNTYCENIVKIGHWFGYAELIYTAHLLKVNIAVYSGKPSNDENGVLKCNLIDCGNEGAETVHILLKRSTKHYWALLSNKEV